MYLMLLTLFLNSSQLLTCFKKYIHLINNLVLDQILLIK
nr:MAG TPA: hypothetical protein [Caudoviricetes sp.]